MIEIVTWISSIHELDLGDVLFFAERAVVPGTKVVFVNDDDIAGALVVLDVAPAPAPDESEDALDDTDEFGRDEEINQGVVLYQGEGSQEEIAIAYVKAWRGE